MRIKVLGCSGGIGPGLRTTALLVNDETLVDAGTGVGDLSLSRMRRIRRVLLTHAHLDHVCGLAFMADNLFGLIDRPVDVFALDETLDALRKHIFNWWIWPDFGELPSTNAPIINYRAIETGHAIHVDGVRYTPFPVLHTVPAVGYVMQDAGGTIVFTGDTYADDSVWSALNALPQLDRLMIEIAFTDEQAELGRVSRHFTPSLLGQELHKLRHRPELLLTHHKPGAEARIEKECRVALADWSYRHLRRGDIITT